MYRQGIFLPSSPCIPTPTRINPIWDARRGKPACVSSPYRKYRQQRAAKHRQHAAVKIMRNPRQHHEGTKLLITNQYSKDTRLCGIPDRSAKRGAGQPVYALGSQICRGNALALAQILPAYIRPPHKAAVYLHTRRPPKAVPKS